MYSIGRFKAHNNSIFDVKFRPNQAKQILTASGDRSIRIWDLDKEQFLVKIDCGHMSSIKTVDFYDSNVFATGGRDGFIRLWDLRVDKCRCCCVCARLKRVQTNHLCVFFLILQSRSS